MTDRPYKNWDWNIGTAYPVPTWDQVKTAILLDIRDELQKINAVLGCSNFQAIPRQLAQINANTKPKRRKAR